MTPTRFQLVRAAFLTWKDGVVERLVTKTKTVTVTPEAEPPVTPKPARENLNGVSVKSLKRKYRTMKADNEQLTTLNTIVSRQRDGWRVAFITCAALFLSVTALFVYDHTTTTAQSDALSQRVAHLEQSIATKNADLDMLLAERNQIAAQYTSLIKDSAGLRQQIAALSDEVSQARATVAARDKELADKSMERVKDVPVQSIEIHKGQPVAVASKDAQEWWNRPITNTVKGWWEDLTK